MTQRIPSLISSLATLRPSRRQLAPLLLAAFALGCFSSCASDDQWTFCVSRSAYGGGYPGELHGGGCGSADEAAVIGLLVILFLPIAIDIVLLPITLTHDLCEGC